MIAYLIDKVDHLFSHHFLFRRIHRPLTEALKVSPLPKASMDLGDGGPHAATCLALMMDASAEHVSGISPAVASGPAATPW